MQLKVTPSIGARYWVAISIASMSGTNLGDIFPDILKTSAPISLLVLALLFGILVLAERATSRGSEIFYWLAILIVRAAATNIADFSVGKARFTYVEVVGVLALLLIGLVDFSRRSGAKRTTGALPPSDGMYWFTMLVAGSVGTVIGDGVGHSFGAVSTGVPLSAVISTVVLLAILGLRARMRWVSAASYWTAVVAVRWWGTNVGDILAFVAGLLISTALTGAALATVLLLWRATDTDRNSAEPQPVSA